MQGHQSLSKIVERHVLRIDGNSKRQQSGPKPASPGAVSDSRRDLDLASLSGRASFGCSRGPRGRIDRVWFQISAHCRMMQELCHACDGVAKMMTIPFFLLSSRLAAEVVRWAEADSGAFLQIRRGESFFNISMKMDRKQRHGMTA